MKLKTAILMFLLNTTSVFAQIDFNLCMKIDSLAAEDQKWRVLNRQVDNHEIDTISKEQVWRMVNKTDSINFLIINKLFYEFGFPGYDKVGEISSRNFWLLVQHADKYPLFQDSVLIKMKLEVEKNNASQLDYAYLVDRVKLNTNHKQIYGTQMQLNSKGTSYEPRPVVKPKKLNDRRKSVGLSTIEEYINEINSQYHGTLK